MVISTSKLTSICDDVFGIKKYGGKFIRRDDYSFMLIDIMNVSCTQLRHLQRCLPHVKLELVSTTASLTGFMLLGHLSSKDPFLNTKSYINLGVLSVFYIVFVVVLLKKHIEYVSSELH